MDMHQKRRMRKQKKQISNEVEGRSNDPSLNIQWYPGHMAKAMRLMKEEIKNVDIILVMGDARCVNASINPDFFKLINTKKFAYVFNKCDLADEVQTAKWQADFKARGIDAFFIDCINKSGVSELSSYLISLKERFRFNREVRVMVTGIPNIGKSMLINTLAKRNGAEVGNKPGVTRAKKWIKVSGNYYLLDTPGVLPPKFETEEDGVKLASIGSVKDTILDKDLLALKIVEFMIEHYPKLLLNRYAIEEIQSTSLETYEKIGLVRGFKNKGGVIDYDRLSTAVIDEFKNGKIGRITFDRYE